METINNIKICKVCEKSCNTFHQNKKICSVCSSKLSNERNKNKHYFKEYYQLNKDRILAKYHEEADLKPKLKKGRPRKIV